MFYRFLFFIALTIFAISCTSKPAEGGNTASASTTAASTTSTTPPAPKAQPYKVAIAVNICKIESAEAGEDIGFYMIEAEDALNKIGIKSERLAEGADLKTIAIKAADGSVAKTIDLSSIVTAENCVGYLVARDGAEHKFIPLEPGKTDVETVAYFK